MYLVIAVVGWVESGVEVVVGNHAEQSGGLVACQKMPSAV